MPQPDGRVYCRDILDGHLLHADVAHRLTRYKGPRVIQTTPERIAFFQQVADGQAINIDYQIFGDLARSLGGILERDFAVHGQRMDGVAVQIEGEQFIDVHRNVNHRRHQLHRAAIRSAEGFLQVRVKGHRVARRHAGNESLLPTGALPHPRAILVWNVDNLTVVVAAFCDGDVCKLGQGGSVRIIQRGSLAARAVREVVAAHQQEGQRLALRHRNLAEAAAGEFGGGAIPEFDRFDRQVVVRIQNDQLRFVGSIADIDRADHLRGRGFGRVPERHPVAGFIIIAGQRERVPRQIDGNALVVVRQPFHFTVGLRVCQQLERRASAFVDVQNFLHRIVEAGIVPRADIFIVRQICGADKDEQPAGGAGV